MLIKLAKLTKSKLLLLIFITIGQVTLAQTVTKQLYLSDPSNALDRIDPVATTDVTTATTPNLFVAPGCSANTSHDDFSSAGYNNFPAEWTAAWSENSDDNSPTGGTMRNVSGELRFQQAGSLDHIQRSANLTGANCATFSFNWRAVSLEVGENIEVWVSNSPNGTFTQLATYTGGAASGTASFDISAYISSATTIRFTNSGGNWSGSNDQAFIDNISIVYGSTGNETVTFTQTPALCSALTIKAGTISINNYISIVSGSMPVNPAITAQLKYGATAIITLTNPTYNNLTGILTWSGTLPSDVIVPSGQAIALVITTTQLGVVFNINYDSQTKPSKINLNTSTYIDISSHAIYDAPYPGGNLITTVPAGSTVYTRTVVTDPFGYNDITGLNLTITPAGTTVAATAVANTSCTKTYQYAWDTNSLSIGSYSLPAIAKEGFENTVTDTQPLTVTLCNPIGVPIFDLGATSTRCQETEEVIYSATATNASLITYSLDTVSIAAGNSINTNTGEISYLAGWAGTSVITVTASGCGAPKTAIHTVTSAPSVTALVFMLGTNSIRCSNTASTITFTATATNTTGITYSLDAASIAGGNTINNLTGEVTFVASWNDITTITATATGCNGPLTSDHIVLNSAIKVVEDGVSGENGTPIVVNVLANDECDINPNSLIIITQPTNGTLQMGINGTITYLPNGNFSGNDNFVYQVCNNAAIPICDIGNVNINVAPDYTNACNEAVIAKTYYMPFPENSTQLREALFQASNNSTGYTNVVRNVTSIVAPYPNTIITYDEWEDGYETDITSPTQATTKIWGDGDLSNGIAPGYPTDILTSSASIILDNKFIYNPRNPANIYFDAKDKIQTTYDVAISKVTGDDAIFSIQAVKTNVVDVTRYGKLFRLGLGEITGVPYFSYAAFFINATKDGTVVNVDLDADGIVDLTKTLNEGEVWFYQGDPSATGIAGVTDVKPGAIITANEIVGVDLVFGGNDNYGTRNINMLTGKYYGNTYYTPVASPTDSTPSVVYFVNSLNTPITINWVSGLPGSGSLVVPANSYNSLTLAVSTSIGYKFWSQGNESFTAVEIMDADSNGQNYDWAISLLNASRLTSFTTIAWAPGSLDGSANYNPLWVTPTANTTLYIKYDGNLTATTATMSPCGVPYDIAVPLSYLQTYQIRDTDNDQSSIALFTCDGTTFAAVYGEDANGAPIGAPALDVGTTLTPKCLEPTVNAIDDKAVTEPNTPITIGVKNNDIAFLCTLDPVSISTVGLLQPANGTIIVNANGTITYTPNFGFLGKDVFEYRICSLEYATKCDVAKINIVVTDCNALANENLITGNVFLEQLPDDGTFDNENFVAGVNVDLYADTNCNGIIDATEIVTKSTVSDLSGNYSFSTFNGYYARDDFEPAATFSGNDGSVNWNTNWVENSDDLNIATGDVRVITDAVSNTRAIRLSGANNGISRNLTFSGALVSSLKFSVRRDALGDSGEGVNVVVNGTTVYTIDDGDFVGTNNFYQDIAVPITSFNANGINTVLFLTNGSVSTTDFFYIDNVELLYFKDPACFIAKVNPYNTNGAYTAALLNQGTATFSGVGACNKNNDLGVLANLVATDDSKSTQTDIPVVINVLKNDVVGVPNTSTVTTSGVSNLPLNGSVTVNVDGTITYTPNPGFIGVDDFEYRVCSLEDPLVCDIALVTVTAACISTSSQNTITGLVYNDISSDGVLDTGDAAHPNVRVNLYHDTNGNGLLNVGEPLIDTETTNSLGSYQFDVVPPVATNDFYDTFSSTSGTSAILASQSYGTASWSLNSWVEVTEIDGFTAGDITISSVNGLQITNASKGARRTANLSTAIAATLSLNYTELGLDLDVNDYVDLQIATNASPASWTLLKRYTGADGNQSGLSTFDITPFISGTTTIRMLSSSRVSMVSGDIVKFDNVKFSYETPIAAKYIVQLVQPIPTGYTLTSPLPSPTGLHTASFTASGSGDCQNNFGIAGSDLVVTKTVDIASPFIGTNVTFTINASNNGPSNATNVIVSDLLPSGYTFVSSTPSVGTYTSGAGVWTIGNLANGASQTLTVTATVKATGVYANTATITATETDPEPENNTSTRTINPLPVVVSIVATTPSASEPATNGLFTVSLSNPVIIPTIVTYTVTGTATNGTDYASITNTLTIPAGDTLATIPVMVTDDATVEGSETVVITLNSTNNSTTITAVSANATATVTIADNDVSVVSIVATTPSASEPATNGEFTVSLTNPMSVPTIVTYTVTGTATNGTDYASITNTVTIPANTTSVTIPVTVTDDVTVEGSETVIVTLNSINNAATITTVSANATATVTIASPAIDAVDDAIAGGNGTTGTPNAGNVLSTNPTNTDTLNANPVTISQVNLTVTAPATPINGGGIPSVDTATGQITVPAGTAAGAYAIVYSICEKLNPDNCDSATVTVIVTAPAIDAVDDAIAGGNGTTGTPNAGNVLSTNPTNTDTLNANPVTISQVNLTVTAPATPINGGGIPSVDTATGQITVPAGTAAGAYAIVYSICEKLNPDNCDSATVTVIVTAPAIDAVDDAIAGGNGTTGTPNAGNVLSANTTNTDTLNANPVTISQVNLTVTAPATPINGGAIPSVNTATGQITVPAGTPAGSYTLVYQICEILNPTNCDTATVTVTVTAAAIVAVDDAGTPVNGFNGGTAFTNVLTNDTLNGAPVVAAQVNTTFVSATNPGVTLSGTDVVVAPGTPAGAYTLVYQICEILNPTNCDNATVTVTVTAPAIVAVDDAGTPVNGFNGGTAFTNVLTNDTLNGSPVVAAQVNLTTVSADAG
ncbi:Ig-like domain-containing protein, partial [Flavobacterium sp. XS2P24]|uniref:Ig-like domain-containing protein n=1 Tax=Flavobacterium sp. XS2P24 TaxID=3041249 RepID=UPI0024A8E96D